MLRLGLQHHQSGRLAEAETQYRQILAKQANHADALHLSGLLAHQRGQHGSAVALIGKAIKANPLNPMYHSNLGLALKSLGKLDDAIKSYRKALSMRTDIAEVHYNLGVAYLEQGKTGKAVECFGSALALKPGSAEVLNSMGSALHRQGKLPEAISCLRTVVAVKPDWAEAHNNLAILLSKQGNLVEAVAHFMRALSIRHDYAEAQNNLGIAYRELGRPNDAIACFRKAVAIKPNYVDALNNLADQFQAKGDFVEAIAIYRRVLAISPVNIEALNNLGYSLRNMGKLADAATAIKQALLIKPDFVDAHVNLAAVYIDQGRFDDAQNSLSSVLQIEPENHRALGMLTTTRRMTLEDVAWQETVARISSDETLPLGKKSALQFALGKYYDDTHQYDLAFNAYKQANMLQRELEGGFDRDRFSRLVDLLVAIYSKDRLNSMQDGCSSSELPVIVVGMPRSGTSLVEQIIASHPQAFGAGELTYWLQWFESNQSAVLAGMPESDLIVKTASEYEQYLRRYSADALRIVDKMPSSFALLGLIHLIFPRARIIHVRRNPLDTCLSVYFQNLSSSHSYGTDLDDLAFYYRQYARLMNHWRSVLPQDRLMEVSYENIISDQSGWSKRIIGFVGLEWSESCLDFYKTERRVGTSSNWQVRQKIYHSSMERWRHYEKHLGKLSGLLD